MCTAASYSYIHVHFIMICKVAIEDEYLAAGLCSSAIRRFEIRAAGHPTAGSRWGGGLPVSRKKRPHVAFRLRLRSLPFPFVSLSPRSGRSSRLRPSLPPENSPIHPQTLNKSSIGARGNPATVGWDRGRRLRSGLEALGSRRRGCLFHAAATAAAPVLEVRLILGGVA